MNGLADAGLMTKIMSANSDDILEGRVRNVSSLPSRDWKLKNYGSPFFVLAAPLIDSLLY